MTTEEVLDEESTCYTTILALLTLAVAAFVYRFLGPDQPKQPVREPVIEEVEVEEQVQSDEPVQVKPTEPVKSKPDEPEAQDSSDGSDFETIHPSDVPELVEDIVPEEVAAVHVEEPVMEDPVVEPVIHDPVVVAVEEPVVEELPVESAEEVETEEDLVKTIELDHIDVALDDYLGRDQFDQPEKSTEQIEPVEVLDTADTPEPIEQKVEQVQEAELVTEPTIEPIDVNRVEEIQPVKTDSPVEQKPDLVQIEDIEKVEETAEDQPIVEDQINHFNLADQTIMTPMAPKHEAKDNGLEDLIEPIKLDLEESQPEPIEDIERKIENVAEQLIADTLGQIKSNVNIIAQDAGDVVKEEKIVNKTAEPDVDEKKVRAEQLSDIADLIAQTPNMAGEGLDIDEQAKLYLE